MVYKCKHAEILYFPLFTFSDFIHILTLFISEGLPWDNPVYICATFITLFFDNDFFFILMSFHIKYYFAALIFIKKNSKI